MVESTARDLFEQYQRALSQPAQQVLAMRLRQQQQQQQQQQMP